MIMKRTKKRESIGSKGIVQNLAQGLARCGQRGIAGAASPSSSGCYRIGTWNVRSLYQAGKIANTIKEISRMKVDILGVVETFWKGEGVFMTEIPDSEEKYRVIYSGGDKNRRGVGMILRGGISKSVLQYNLISDRIMTLRLKAAPVNLLLIQVYAPCEDGEEDEKESFYELLDQTIKENGRGRECLMVMGDFNGKVGKNKEDTIGPFGMGLKNENGQYIIELCKKHNLFATNTWFQQKQSAQHTWKSPDGKIKNQIDYILVDKRFRNGIRNSKSMPGADCGSDHNPVVTTMQIKLKGPKRIKVADKWK